MADNVVRPMQTPRQFLSWAAGQATEQALGGDLPDGDAREIRAAIETEAAKLLHGSVNRELGNAKRLAKQMAKLEGRTRKAIRKAEKRLAKAERLVAAYRDKPHLLDRKRAAKREVLELTATAGKAGQATAEWESWRGQLQRLIPEVEKAVARVEPTRPSLPAGQQAIIVGGSGPGPAWRAPEPEPDTAERQP